MTRLDHQSFWMKLWCPAWCVGACSRTLMNKSSSLFTNHAQTSDAEKLSDFPRSCKSSPWTGRYGRKAVRAEAMPRRSAWAACLGCALARATASIVLKHWHRQLVRTAIYDQAIWTPGRFETRRARRERQRLRRSLPPDHHAVRPLCLVAPRRRRCRGTGILLAASVVPVFLFSRSLP